MKQVLSHWVGNRTQVQTTDTNKQTKKGDFIQHKMAGQGNTKMQNHKKINFVPFATNTEETQVWLEAKNIQR